MTSLLLYPASAAVASLLLHRAWRRIQLSRAKHRSLAGHPRMARLLSRLLPYYAYDQGEFFSSDGAPQPVAASRRAAFERLAAHFSEQSPRSLALGETLAGDLSDVAFTNAYRVPFPYRDLVREKLKTGGVLVASDGARVRDLDGHWSYDLSGSYGLNLFGYEVYKRCIERAVGRVGELGPVLGAFHPVVAENARRLKAISGLDEVSFHMSGTEAVMQAVRLARFHTRRSKLVRFCGAYHGWWDGVQPGVGNPLPVRDAYTLRELDQRTLQVLATRRDIACVLVNPLQALHPNASAPSDGTLMGNHRSTSYDRAAYTAWLAALREVCTRRGIVLIFDEVFMGFRLAPGGAQEFFGVRADLVTYGKSVGGGLPIGVVCGRRDLMKRFRDDRPSEICFARGTFNSHPYVMAAMDEVLRHLEDPAVRSSYRDLEPRWDGRARQLNERLAALDLPVRVANLVSVWTTLYTRPGRYHWMLQFYLREQGLHLGWIGTGRFIFSHDLSDADFEQIVLRFTAAARAMDADGWWWRDPALTDRAIKARMRAQMRARLSRGILRSLARSLTRR